MSAARRSRSFSASAFVSLLVASALLVAMPVRAEPGEAGTASDGAPGESSWGLFRYEMPSNVLALEVDLGGAFGITDSDPASVVSSSGSNDGFAAGLGFVYRPDYFLSPFLDFAYYDLGGTTDHVETADGLVTAKNTLSMWALTPGIVVDYWLLHARFGVSFENLMAEGKVEGETASSSRLSLGYVFGLGGTIYRWSDFAAGLESRVVLNPVSDVIVVTVGATGTWDFVSF
jgi:hypothetical protein